MRKGLVLIVCAVVLVGACGSDDEPAIEGNVGDAPAASSEHNDADVAFAQNMIVHHEQAIEMADVVLAKGADAEVKAVATRIKDAQAPEIETLESWLTAWGEERTPGGAAHGGMDMGGSDETTMMSEQEMNALEASQGAELDGMFLEMMIRHHEGAISMAQTELEDGEFSEAKALAQRIIDDQTAEIEAMRRLLSSLEG